MGCNIRAREKVHRVLNHKGVKDVEFLFRSAGKLNQGMSKLIIEVVENCDICKRNSDLAQSQMWLYQEQVTSIQRSLGI